LSGIGVRDRQVFNTGSFTAPVEEPVVRELAPDLVGNPPGHRGVLHVLEGQLAREQLVGTYAYARVEQRVYGHAKSCEVPAEVLVNALLHTRVGSEEVRFRG